jgi:uncharacterized protein YecT (DUF1311 family)
VSRISGGGGGIALIVVVLAYVALVSARPLQAEPAAPAPAPQEDCGDRKSTADIVECLATQTAVWDRRLSSAYQKLFESLPARRRDRLRNAQRLWIQFRDANCAYFASRSGTIARVEAGQCLLRLTTARAMELEEGI